MRDSDALLRFWDRFVDAFGLVMLNGSRVGPARLRATAELLLRQEQHGSLLATAALDQLETMMADPDVEETIREWGAPSPTTRATVKERG